MRHPVKLYMASSTSAMAAQQLMDAQRFTARWLLMHGQADTPLKGIGCEWSYDRQHAPATWPTTWPVLRWPVTQSKN